MLRPRAAKKTRQQTDLTLQTAREPDPLEYPDWDALVRDAREAVLTLMRAMSPGRKFELTAGLCDLARNRMEAEIRMGSPNASDEDVRREVIRRVVPEELRRKAYGW